ncbi:hypothetical protein [Polyangium mundeleinium]|uniref:Lipoprotein n=1 Tax=Polyangium mundeleinium TaxID=2995306 RepID=A0ABT5EI30_9BACT|nr:hypothetical protein [Polyangium mundeleinium]MDC0740410.1 hypothetical protein [Polyangium mundeleinium]
MLRLAWTSIAFVVAAALVTGCSASGTTPRGTGSGGAGGSGGEGGGPLFDGGMEADGGKDCNERAELVYLLAQENALYSFSPPTLTFQKIGVVSCPATQGASPFSMAVDRDATAYVLYDDGHLFRVSTVDASCEGTSFVPKTGAFGRFGMGFSTDGPDVTKETLYVADYGGSGLGRIDLATMELETLGFYDAIFDSAELSGTGDGHLWGFFTTAPPIVAELDPKTSHVLSQSSQPSLDIGTAWAFAFWGGDFYLFTCPGVASRIDRYRPKDGTTVNLKSNIGFRVVGAGVSTCAPLEPPK